jgi:type IV secretory pathway VirB10-like protein
MANNDVSGPSDPPGFSGVKKWLDPKLAVPVLIAAAIFALTRPTSVAHPNAAPITAADVASLVATTPQPTPKATLAPTAPPPMPTMPPTPPQTMALTDVAQPPSGDANNAAVQVQPTPTAPPTISPAEAARQRRMAEDIAALEAPVETKPMMLSPVKAAVAPAKPAEDLWLRRGMSIDATLYTSIDSTISAGLIVAYLSEDVWDFTHRHIIAPRGAKLIGQYGGSGTSVAQGQARIPATFDQIQLDDRVIDLGAQPGVDQTGTTGLGATVDNHTRKELANFLVLAAVGAVLNRGGGCGSNCGVSYGSNSSSVGGSVIQSGQQILAPHNATQESPTLHVAAGAQIGLMLTADIRVQEWRP